MKFKGAIKALIPKVQLPRYFRITSEPLPGGATQVRAKFLEKDYAKQVPTATPTVLDVLEAFPDVKLDKVSPVAKAALGFIMLPARWELECNPAQNIEGFRVTVDVHLRSGTKHWEKEFPVRAMQLAEFVDILEWVKQVNRATS